MISKSPHRRAFTLVELLIVIGIIAVLMALSMVAILRAHKQAVRSRMQADLALIGTALEAYKQDFGDYPRFDDDATAKGLNAPTAPLRYRGAILLCRALLSPGPAVDQSGGNIGFGWDGADGPGFRIRPGGQGKVYQPYIQSDKFQLGGMDKKNFSDAVINDLNGSPILYYPALPGTPAIASPSIFIASTPPAGYGAVVSRPFYNAYDNIDLFHQQMDTDVIAVNRFELILGDRNLNGVIDTGETATTTQPYLLWCAGDDGIFGCHPSGLSGQPLSPGDRTANVTNFDIPPDLRK